MQSSAVLKTPALWRQVQRQNFTDWKKLLTFLRLSEDIPVLSSSPFPLNLPLRLAQKIKKGDPSDPILRQFLPLQEEKRVNELFVLDPVQDHLFVKAPKLLHKYKGRALLLASSACAMHCRYCFRKNFDYETERGFDKELEEIRRDKTVSEVLLSGGDPLSLSEEQMGSLLQDLDAIEHVQRIRFHTRFPLGIPERIDEAFLNQLSACRKQIIFAIHTNHAAEFDSTILDRLKKVQKLGIPLLSQTVLLQGVNDSVQALEELFLLLINQGIIPYYLHQLDRVAGSEHFEVSEERGCELIAELRKCLPGYAVPLYVKEEAHKPHKSAITSGPVS